MDTKEIEVIKDHMLISYSLCRRRSIGPLPSCYSELKSEMNAIGITPQPSRRDTEKYATQGLNIVARGMHDATIALKLCFTVNIIP